METSMYDTLLQLPLFQGLCKDDFTCIIEKVKFHFRNYNGEETIVKQGEACNQLIFLLEGKLSTIVADEEQNYRFSETLTAPFVIEPYSLFGMHTCYNATYKVQEQAKVLVIDKSYILSELINYEIFRLNYLNILSNRVQMNSHKLWHTHIGTLKEKFANFLLLRCTKPTGEKVLQIGMEDLARLINETRINVSKLLNDLQSKGIIHLKRKVIFIPDMQELVKELNQ